MTTTQELLKSSFELNLNNYGPEDVERLNDWAINAYAALETLQAEVARLIRDRDSVWALKEHKEVLLSQMTSERDAALARLAEIEKQFADAAKQHSLTLVKVVDGYALMKLGVITAAAGASPVEPSQAGVVEPVMQRGISALQDVVDTLETYGKYHDDEGEFTRYLSDLLQAIATPQAAAQPPAPSDAAREYMTGYSDGREWAKPSQALVVEPVYQYQLANGNWIDQTKESYDYNVKHGQATVRMLYATPQAAPLYAKEQQ